jgi:cytochrome c
MDDQITFRYAGGQNGVAVGTPRMLVDVRRDAVDGPIVQTCELVSTGTNNNTYTDQTCLLTGDTAGSFRIYLTFRDAPGGPTANMGNLNWVQFSGPGVGV